MTEDLSNVGKRGRISSEQDHDMTYRSKKFNSSKDSLKNVVAKLLRDLREHLHDLHRPG